MGLLEDLLALEFHLYFVDLLMNLTHNVLVIMSVLEKGEVRLLRANTLYLIQILSSFTESLDSEEVKILAIISIVASGVIGLVAGVIGGIIEGAIYNYFGIGQVANTQIGNPGSYVQCASDLVGDIQTLQYARNLASMLQLGPVGTAGRFMGIAIPFILC